MAETNAFEMGQPDPSVIKMQTDPAEEFVPIDVTNGKKTSSTPLTNEGTPVEKSNHSQLL